MYKYISLKHTHKVIVSPGSCSRFWNTKSNGSSVIWTVTWPPLGWDEVTFFVWRKKRTVRKLSLYQPWLLMVRCTAWGVEVHRTGVFRFTALWDVLPIGAGVSRDLLPPSSRYQFNPPWRSRLNFPPKDWYPSTNTHGCASQKTVMINCSVFSVYRIDMKHYQQGQGDYSSYISSEIPILSYSVIFIHLPV
jgi:hypothetical protein